MAQTSIFRGVQTKTLKHLDGSLGGYYRGTQVARKAADGTVTLNTGGWFTNTTKTRMNQFASEFCNNRFSVFQRKFQWFVSYDACEWAYVDGMSFKL